MAPDEPCCRDRAGASLRRGGETVGRRAVAGWVERRGGDPVEPARVSARILSYGATLQSMMMAGRDGRRVDVTLGYDDVAACEAKRWREPAGAILSLFRRFAVPPLL